MKINERLIALRKAKGISQYELIELSGVSKSFVRDVEEGLSVPSIPKLTQLLDALGYNLSEFFNEDACQFYLSPKEQEHMTAYRTLSPRQQRSIEEIIELYNISNNNSKNV